MRTAVARRCHAWPLAWPLHSSHPSCPSLACRDAPGVLTDIASLMRWFWPTAITRQQPPNNVLKRLLQSVAHANKDGQVLRTLMAGGGLRCGVAWGLTGFAACRVRCRTKGALCEVLV